MKILAIDTSTNVASTAILSENVLIAESIVDDKLNHSLNLLPTLEVMLKSSGLTYGDFDYFAVTVGPGSFTGLRIGISTVKGLAQATSTPVIPVSTLEALSYNLLYSKGYICPLLDARRKRFYSALFKCDGSGEIERIKEDSDITPENLFKWLEPLDEPIFVLGDGTEYFKESISDLNYISVLPYLRTNKAASLGTCALRKLEQSIDYHELSPVYLRASYAEEKK